jgi:deoxycytidylate deaminase
VTRQQEKLILMLHFGTGLADLSTCRRAQNAAVAFPPDFSEVTAIGYNGPAAGEPVESCRGATGNCGCIHAEANVCSKLGWPASRQLLLYTTTMPCEACAGLIINARRFPVVIFRDAYRLPEGHGRLKRAGIEVVQALDLVADSEKASKCLSVLINRVRTISR